MWCGIFHDHLCVGGIYISNHPAFFHAFSLDTNFIFVTESYCSLFCCCSSSASFPKMPFSLCRPHYIFSFILLYNKEAVSHMVGSLSVSASYVAAIGADTALYNFANWFLIRLVMFFIYRNLWTKKWVRKILLDHYSCHTPVPLQVNFEAWINRWKMTIELLKLYLEA